MFKKMGSLMVPYKRNLLSVKKAKEPVDMVDNKRYVTISQLFVLLYHFYVGVNDPDVYYLDAEETAEKFQGRINAEVELSKEDLEKLLYYTTLAYENKTYWNPAQGDYEGFVRSLLTNEEQYDQLLGYIVPKKTNRKGRII